MALTINAKTFTPDSFGVDAISYIGTTKTVSVKDDCRLARTKPKPSAVFSGVGRVQAKLVRTLTLTGALTPTGDMIVDINVSVPVGYAGADVDTSLNDMGALLSSATMKTLVKSQQVSY